jgi:hypothetical protein
MLPDVEQAVIDLSGILDRQVQEWTGWSPIREGASESLAADNVVYVVNCPRVHSFTLEELEKLSLDKRTRDVSEVSRFGHLSCASNAST